MDIGTFFGHSYVYISATLLLLAFNLIGAFDGLYFHMYKYRLHRIPEARLEHKIHAARGLLFIPITIIFFVINSAGWLLWLGILILTLDIILEIIDLLVEKEARALIGGVSSAESAIHVAATSARIAAIALLLGDKPPSAYMSLMYYRLPTEYPPVLTIFGITVAIGAGVGVLCQLVSMFVDYITRSNQARLVSNEGIIDGNYRISHVYLSVLPALLLEGLLRLLRKSIKEVVPNTDIPKNAILYSFHQDALLTLSTKFLIDLPKVAYIGYHGFGSYFPTFYYYRLGIKAIRYDRRKEKPKETIIRELNNWDGMVVIRTDSGKPYGKVRASLIDIANATGRPLVPMVQKANRFISISQHAMPLPGATVTTVIGKAIDNRVIKNMSRDAACEYLQDSIGNIKA